LTARPTRDLAPDFRRYQYGGTVGGPIVKNRTHYFVAVERTDENQFLTVNAAGRWPQYEGTYKSDQYRWTYTVKVDHQLSQRQSIFARASQEVEYRPVITTGGRVHPTNSFDFAVPRDSYVVGHTWVASPSLINDLRLQYAYAKYEVAPPYSHGSWEPGDFGADRLDQCTAVFNYPSLGLGGCGNSQMGPEKRFQIRTRRRGRAAATRSSSEPTSTTSPSAQTASARRWGRGRSRATSSTTPPTARPTRRSTRTRCPPSPKSPRSSSRSSCRTTGRSAVP
jgi:hypothetical protein